MSVPANIRCALNVGTAAALLAACGGSQPIGAPGAMPQSYENRSERNTSIAETVIYTFSRRRGGGANPRAPLIDVSGALYGTTFIGGFKHHRFRGSVFSVTPSGKETVLHRFMGRGDGRYPYSSLLYVDGIMYGTTEQGGKRNRGTVFSITSNGAETVLHSFKGSDGWGPHAALINLNGTLYGTTESGGSSNCNGYGCGTVFKITLAGEESVLHRFGSSGDGVDPFAGLVNVKGTLYGTTAGGGAQDNGTVFAIAPSGKESILHRFNGGPSDGAEPCAGLINVDGTLYGTTYAGGAYDGGTVFSITPSGEETLLHSFNVPKEGGGPEAGLVEVNGTLYGTTYTGGAYDGGTVFSIMPSGTEVTLYSFGTNYKDGNRPEAGLINVKGTLYGTTVFGGAGNNGAIYSLTGI